MFFDDIFYPGNKKKRAEISNLRGEILNTLNQYKSAWNENATLLNSVFQQAAKPDTPFYGMTIPLITKSVTDNTIGDCLTEINATITTTKDKLNKLMEDIGVTELLPNDWKDKGVKLEEIGETKALRICKIIGATLAGAGAAYLGSYVFQGISVCLVIASAITGVVTGVGSIVGGVLAGAIIGAAAFVITDVIASAITGAIERKKLKDAISALTQLRDSVLPLRDAAVKLGSITQNIKDGNYKLADGWYLMRDEDGNYIIIKNGRQVAMAFAA